ncbi:hypothetical protein AVEN_76121-1 [Araneus ventricosus]|uniref:Secreted protein n=1 Tax=Araneus ventricosus TaxID=182803 RepID=A0A4Y2T4Z6_ARAVE|nr:hypothetical protein AVEN_76121-1 [Araneus ventricosus]
MRWNDDASFIYFSLTLLFAFHFSSASNIARPQCSSGKLSTSEQERSRWCGADVWKGGGVPAQVSTSSSDGCSKLRGTSKNIPRFASKRDVNITKLKLTKLLQFKTVVEIKLRMRNKSRRMLW